MVRASGHRDEQRGSAVVDFVLVGALLSLMFISILQLALVLHIRNTLIDAAVSGAQFGTLADRSANEGAARSKALIAGALPPGFAEQISYSEKEIGGMRTLEISVKAPLPLIGLIGVGQTLEVSGHAAFQD